jgi:hypothetical protein
LPSHDPLLENPPTFPEFAEFLRFIPEPNNVDTAPTLILLVVDAPLPVTDANVSVSV